MSEKSNKIVIAIGMWLWMLFSSFVLAGFILLTWKDPSHLASIAYVGVWIMTLHMANELRKKRKDSHDES